MAHHHLKVGIIGVGMVGSQLKRFFEDVRKYERGRDLFLFDIDTAKGCADDINRADIVFISVPTPSMRDGSADLTRVDAALRMLKGEKIAVIKSTVSPGTVEVFQKKYPCLKILFNPEFLTESRAWEDMVNPDRQIVGHTAVSRPYASVVLNLLPAAYFSSPGTLGTYTFMRVSATEAEVGKYAGNTFGALKVTYANILKDFCDSIEGVLRKKKILSPVAYARVRAMLAHDRRIGDAWLDVEYQGYRGYGGYCFTKDTKALMQHGEVLLKTLPKKSADRARLSGGLKFLKAMRRYNKILLATQGLTENDVSVHDREWIQRKLKNKK